MKMIIAKMGVSGAMVGLAALGFQPFIDGVVAKSSQVWNLAMDQVTRVEVVKEYVAPPKLSTDQLIDKISVEMGIDPLITHAIARQESGKNYQEDALRYEAHLEPRFAKFGKGREETRMLATSIGVMQIISGFHLKTCGLDSYSQLFDRETNIRCGLTVLKDCLARHQSKPKLSQYRSALVCYNGSDVYADEVIGNIGEIAIERSI